MYSCTKCEKEFSSRQALNAHQVAHKEGIRFKNGRKVYKNRHERIKSPCLYCNTELEYLPSKARKYCNSTCQHAHRTSLAIESRNYTRSNAFNYFKKNTKYKCAECGVGDT